MNTSTFAQALSFHAECNLSISAKQIGFTLFALAMVLLENWLRFPVQPLIDNYLHAAISRISAVTNAVVNYRFK